MKITKPGKLPNPKAIVLKGKCPNCGCEFEAPKEEWKRNEGPSSSPYAWRDGADGPPYYTMICPTTRCLREVKAYNSDITH